MAGSKRMLLMRYSNKVPSKGVDPLVRSELDIIVIINSTKDQA